ncbi:MAG: bifunctional hydroxymethylpyrimidine kinase/phosphomethylpyrimidine kinase [Eubacteriales bacterium]|jgi:pyridoxine kinase
MIPPKKVLTVHDICTLGRCSTVTATAVLAACGLQPCPVISAILSSTVDFGEFYTQDTMEAVVGCTPYLKRFAGGFDAIYTGYLGGPGQVEQVLKLARTLSDSRTLLIVDPVLGDNGALYPTFDEEMVREMRRLTRRAKVLLPNATEARLLVGLDPRQPLSPAEMQQLARSLCQPGQSLVITGAEQTNGLLTTLCLESAQGPLIALRHRAVPAHYPGSGDLFASVLTGLLVQGKSLPEACRFACGFVARMMQLAQAARCPSQQGLPYEPYLPMLREDRPPFDVQVEVLP